MRKDYYRQRKKYHGRLFFQFVCQFTSGWGVPHLHPIILPLVPFPFQGTSPSHNTSTGPMSFLGNPSDWSWVPSGGRGGTPVPDRGVTPVPSGEIPQSQTVPGWVPPWPDQDGVPLARTGWGTPQPGHDGVAPWQGQDGVPPGQDWGTPPPGQVRLGYPQGRLCLGRLCHGWYASCGFPQEDFLVFSLR